MIKKNTESAVTTRVFYIHCYSDIHMDFYLLFLKTIL